MDKPNAFFIRTFGFRPVLGTAWNGPKEGWVWFRAEGQERTKAARQDQVFPLEHMTEYNNACREYLELSEQAQMVMKRWVDQRPHAQFPDRSPHEAMVHVGGVLWEVGNHGAPYGSPLTEGGSNG